MVIRTYERNGYTVYPIVVPAGYGLETCNFYLVKHDSGLTLIDAGMPDDSSWEGLIKALENNSFRLEDLTEILFTHHHIDHVGLVNRITKTHSIPVYAHSLSVPRLKRDKEFLKMRVEFFEQLYHEMNCGEEGKKQIQYLKKSINKNDHLKVEQEITTLQEGMSLFNFKIKEVPGHAPDQIAFIDETSKWCFAGDHLIQHISSNALVEPDLLGKRIHSLVDYKNSLKAFIDVNVDFVFSGHGELIQDPKKLIEMRLSKIKKKSEKVKGLIDSGITTGSELAKHLYQRHYSTQFALVMSEVIGHLDALESDGQIEKTMRAGAWHYRLG
nr:MBL fold metallo-hydrolase [Alkalihalobacterium elongatum]